MITKNGWVGCDLDGTLAQHTTWRGEAYIGPPIPEAVDRIKKLMASGWTIKILTARMSEKNPEAKEITRRAISRWTLEHVGIALEAVSEKDYAMVALYDDRAIQVELNTGKVLGVDFMDVEPGKIILVEDKTVEMPECVKDLIFSTSFIANRMGLEGGELSRKIIAVNEHYGIRNPLE